MFAAFSSISIGFYSPRQEFLQKMKKNPTSGGVTITDPIQAPISLLMPLFSSVVNVSHRRIVQMKKCLQGKIFRPSNNLGFDPFPSSIGHFETQWRPSWISHVSNTGSAPRIRQISYRGCAFVKMICFVLDRFVFMLIDLDNCKKRLGVWFCVFWEAEHLFMYGKHS